MGIVWTNTAQLETQIERSELKVLQQDKDFWGLCFWPGIKKNNQTE